MTQPFSVALPAHLAALKMPRTRSDADTDIRLTRGPHKGTVARLPRPRDFAYQCLIPAIADSGRYVAQDRSTGDLYTVPMAGEASVTKPLDPAFWADTITAHAAVFPAIEGADVYTSLQRLAEALPDKAREYLDEAVRTLKTKPGKFGDPMPVDALPAPYVPAPVIPAPASIEDVIDKPRPVPRKTQDEYNAEYRARQTAETESLCREYLAAIDWGRYGESVPSTVLWADAEPSLTARGANTSGRTTFHRLAREVLNRRRTSGGYVYTPR